MEISESKSVLPNIHLCSIWIEKDLWRSTPCTVLFMSGCKRGSPQQRKYHSFRASEYPTIKKIRCETEKISFQKVQHSKHFIDSVWPNRSSPQFSPIFDTTTNLPKTSNPLFSGSPVQSHHIPLPRIPCQNLNLSEYLSALHHILSYQST